MAPSSSRRAVLAAVPAIVLCGCLGTDSEETPEVTDDDPTDGQGVAGTPTANTTPTAGADEMTPTDDGTPPDGRTPVPPEDREQLVERLPEPSPLSSVLVDLIVAEDRAQFANDRDLYYRNGALRVSITLTTDGEPPTAYLLDDWSESGDTVVAYVDVADLVDLALDENVRLVSPYSAPETH